MKKFEYKIESRTVEIESDYEVKREHFWKYEKELVKLFNECGSKGFDVYNYKIDEIDYIDEERMKQWEHYRKNHSKPFAKIVIKLFLKRETVDNDVDDKDFRNALVNIYKTVLNTEKMVSLLSKRIELLEEELDNTKKKQHRKKEI